MSWFNRIVGLFAVGAFFLGTWEQNTNLILFGGLGYLMTLLWHIIEQLEKSNE